MAGSKFQVFWLIQKGKINQQRSVSEAPRAAIWIAAGASGGLDYKVAYKRPTP